MRNSARSRRIVWIGETVLDEHLHATAQLGILEHLARRGYDVEFRAMYSRNKHTFTNSRTKISCFPLRSIPLIQRFFFCVILFLFLPIYVLMRKPRVIITEYGISILAFVWWPLLRHCANTRLILDVRSTPVEVNDLRNALLSFAFKMSILVAKRLFDGMTTVTTPMKADLINYFHLEPDKIEVWPNGVSLDIFDPAKYSLDRVHLREEHGLREAFVILYHGAVSPQRGILEFVEAMDYLQKEQHLLRDIIFFVLGDGPALPMIRELVQERGLQDSVILHPRVAYSEVPKYIAMSDVGLVPPPNLPDWVHQCPLNLLEYLAMEKPVIVTDIPCNRIVVGSGTCARYVSNAIPSEFADAIMYLHNRKQSLAELGLCGRDIIKENYDWSKIAMRLEAFLKCQ